MYQNYNKNFNANSNQNRNGHSDIKKEDIKKEDIKEEDIKKEDSSKKMSDKLDEPIVAGVVSCKKLNVRESPSMKANIICVINEGDRITVAPIYNVDIPDEWAHIKLSNGVCGYVVADFLSEA